jgi:transcriptional regulator with XRE-family HTH domain
VATLGGMSMWFYLDPEGCRILREAREFKGMKQRELADLLKINRSTYSRIEAGGGKLSTKQRIILENELDLKPDSLSPKTIPTNSVQTLDQKIQTIQELLQTLDRKLQSIGELLKILTVYAKHTTERVNDLEALMERQHPVERRRTSEKQPLKIFSSDKVSHTIEELLQSLSPSDRFRLEAYFNRLPKKWSNPRLKPLINHSDILPLSNSYPRLIPLITREKITAAHFPATPEQ